MDRHESRSVGEDSLHLKKSDHVGHTVHDIILCQDVGSIVHDFLHCFALPCALKGCACNIGHRFGIVEFQSLLKTALGSQPYGEKSQLLLLFWGEMHSRLN